MTTTYQETVNRFRVVRIEKLPAEHAASYRLNAPECLFDDPDLGPDCTRSLIWSFVDEADAIEQAARDNDDNQLWFQRYEVVDGGKPETIERSILF